MEEFGHVKRLNSVANVFIVVHLSQVSTVDALFDLLILTDYYLGCVLPLRLPDSVLKALM